MQLRDVQSGKFVRVLTPAESGVGEYGGVVSALVADQDVPWLHGGTFEVLETDEGGWELVTRAEPYVSGKWLETHGSAGGFWRPSWSLRTAAGSAPDANASEWGGESPHVEPSAAAAAGPSGPAGGQGRKGGDWGGYAGGRV